MKKIVSLILASVMLLSVLSVVSFAAEAGADSFAILSEAMSAETFKASNGLELPYRLYVPENYDAEKEYSFLIFLHGAGNKGSDNERQIKEHTKLLERIVAGETFEYDGKTINAGEEFIVIAPQCASDSQWVDTDWSIHPDPSYKLDEMPISKHNTAVVELIEHIKNNYSLNPERMYATGLSMGGFGLWDLLMRYPDMFAAAVPMGGAGDPSKASIIRETPVWTFHQMHDPLVAPNGTVAMVKALVEAGAEVRFTPYFDTEHNAWRRGYAEPDMFTWFYSHTKNEDTVAYSDKIATSGASSWAKGEVALAYAANIMPEALVGKYRENITRKEFCQMVVNILPKDLKARRAAKFKDCDDAAVRYAYSVGVINGLNDSTFAPDAPATRQEIATMLYRAFMLIAPDAKSEFTGTSPDRATIADWAIDAVDFLNENEVMKGDEKGNINPLANTTCEEATLLAWRAFCEASYYGKGEK